MTNYVAIRHVLRERVRDSVKAGQTIAVWFSCGAASAVAAYMTLRRYSDIAKVRIVNTPIAEEDVDNRRFMRDVENWLGVKIEIVVNPKWADQSAEVVWAERNGMSFPHGAPCTVELKKGARQFWESANKVDWHVLGFTVDEVKRHQRFVTLERENVLPVLIDGMITKRDCFTVLRNAGIELPRVYGLGYPNANCIGCVKATSPTYWNHVRAVHPDVFERRAKQSRNLGARLARYKGQRVFLDELPADAIGKPMKNMDVECGIFCEERS